MRLKLHRVLVPPPFQMDRLLPLCYLSGVQNPEPLGLKNCALAIYFSPSRLILRFSRNVSVTDALVRYVLAWFGRISCFYSEDYPDLRGLQRHLFFLATPLDLHRARHTRDAVSYVALVWLLIRAFYSKTLIRPGLSLSSRKPCRFVLPAENDLSWLQLGPPLTEVGLTLMPYSHSGYSAQHMSPHFAYPIGLDRCCTLFELGAFVPIASSRRLS